MSRLCLVSLSVFAVSCATGASTSKGQPSTVGGDQVNLPFEITYDRFGGVSSGSTEAPKSALLVLYQNGRADVGGQLGQPVIESQLSKKQVLRITALIAQEPQLGSFDWKNVHKQIGVAGTDLVSVLIEIKSSRNKQSAWVYAFEPLVGVHGGEAFAGKLEHARTVPGFVRFSEVASELDALRSELLAAHNANRLDSER